VLPENGGRIASIRCNRSGTEFLFGRSNYEAIAAFSADAGFEESDCAGMDECLPTVSLSIDESGLASAADHGDLWRHAWTVVEQNESQVTLATECFSQPLSFMRTLRVEGHRLEFDYSIRSLAPMLVPFLYACHPLFAFDPGDRVILPREVDQLRLGYALEERVGRVGEWVDWPLAIHRDEQIELDRVGETANRSAEMLYTGCLNSGACALYRARHRQAIVVHFDTAMLPYLGLWLCNGGWPEIQGPHQQYAVAMEPTVAPCGGLAEAVAADLAPLLEPDASFDFSISMEVLGCDRPWSYDEVREYINLLHAPL
jgi:hypothetical protein